MEHHFFEESKSNIGLLLVVWLEPTTYWSQTQTLNHQDHHNDLYVVR